MTVADYPSFIAFAAAGVPPAYFALKLRVANRPFSLLALLLAAALFVHGLFHLLRALEGPLSGVQALEAASAVLVLIFALGYWPLRRRDSRAP